MYGWILSSIHDLDPGPSSSVINKLVSRPHSRAAIYPLEGSELLATKLSLLATKRKHILCDKQHFVNKHLWNRRTLAIIIELT
jgi:hypothetical protein